MKLNKQITIKEMAITGIMPVSSMSAARTYKDPDSGFPKPQRIGRVNYFERSKVYKWLNSRATRNGEPVPAGTIQDGDKLCDTSGVSVLVDRSKAWVWLNITKNKKLTIVNLSPDGKSKNPRRYFVEREIIEAFPALAELAQQEAA